jgi:hypothetical protein
MIERGLKMKKVIDMFCAREDSFKEYAISHTEWETFSKICEFLRPFNEITKLLSGQTYSSICFVIPLLRHLLEHIKSTNEASLSSCSTPIETKFKDYFQHLKKNYSYFAVLLDQKLNITYLSDILSENEFKNIEKLFR